MAAGADIFVTNTDNYSPLRLALSAGGERQEWLLTSSVINSSDGSGNTPMHYAAEWKLYNAITELVEKGSSVNAQNANGQTPLFSAVHADSPDAIVLLIRNGAQKNARDIFVNQYSHFLKTGYHSRLVLSTAFRGEKRRRGTGRRRRQPRFLPITRGGRIASEDNWGYTEEKSDSARKAEGGIGV